MPTAAQTWTTVDFEADVSRHAGMDVVSVRGELDIATSRRLRDVVLDPDLTSPAGLIVDLTQVSFLDSTGIGTLVAAWRRSLAAEQPFAIVCPPGQALRVLGIVQLDGLVGIWPSFDEAVAALDAA